MSDWWTYDKTVSSRMLAGGGVFIVLLFCIISVNAQTGRLDKIM